MPQVAPTTALPDGVEIFRAGRHVDDGGTTHEFSEADVRRMVEVYDPATREAPLTVGHPEHNLPAYGWVKGLAVNAAGRLAMSTHNVLPQFAEMVRAQSFKKRSASFYPPAHPNNPTPGAWYLRHVAFLGAQPPAIAGLADIKFSEGDAEGVVQFSDSSPHTTPQEQSDMDKDLQAKLDAATAEAAKEKAAREAAELKSKEADEKLAQFAEQQKQTRTAGFIAFAEAQVKAGKLLPKDQAMAVATMEALADAASVSFSEGNTTRQESPLLWLQGRISNATPVVSFGEFRPGETQGVQAGDAKGKTDAEIHQAAEAYARQHKVSYAEAARAVVTFTG